MDILPAYCGLMCETCPIFQASLEPDLFKQQKMRESIAEECRRIYGMDLQASDIGDCEGCRTGTGKIFKGCLDCEIRICARARNLENCAFCRDYACNKLLKHFEVDPEARIRLDEMRRLRLGSHESNFN